VPLPSGSRFADHHRRPSRTSPPPLSSNPNRLSSSGVSGIVGPGGSTLTPRRSLSNVGGSGILPPPTVTGSRRLSNTGSSHGGYSHSRSGSTSSITGIMAPVGIHNHANGGGIGGGGVSNIAGPRSSIYNSGSGAYGSASERRNMSISESNVPYHAPAPLSPPRHRGSGSSTSSESRTRTSGMSMSMSMSMLGGGGGGAGASSSGYNSSPRGSFGGSVGYASGRGHSQSASQSRYMDDYEYSDYRPEVPLRHSSLATGGVSGLTRGGSGSFRARTGGSGPNIPSPSALASRRTTYGGGSGSGASSGTASLGRNAGSGMMGGGHRQYQSGAGRTSMYT
jgi:hypothetical protein